MPPHTPLLRRLRLPQLQLVRMAGGGANFREMAEALHVTQPALTKMVHELERVLEARVFERGPAGVRLTAVGQAVLVHTQRALTALDQLAEELPRYREGATPALRVGSPAFTASALLAGPVAASLQRAPVTRVLMRDGVSAQLLALLAAGELDCVIGSVDEASSTDADLARLHFEPLYDDRVTFVTHPATPGAASLRHLEQVCTRPWVMGPSTSQVWMALRQAFTAGGLPLPRGVVETSSVPAIGAVLQQAPGTIGALRADAGRYLVRHYGLRMLRITPPVGLSPVGIVRMRAAPPSAALDDLLERVRAEVRHLFGEEG